MRQLKFFKSFLSLKIFKGFIAYLVVGLLLVLLIPSQVKSHISPNSITSHNNYEVSINDTIAQSNSGDAVIREVMDKLRANQVRVNYFAIEGRCHGQFFRREYGNSRASDNSEVKVASSMLTEFGIDTMDKVKQLSNSNIQLANNSWNAWLAAQVRGVLARNQFTGWIQVRGRHIPDGKPCVISLSTSGCDRRYNYCPL